VTHPSSCPVCSGGSFSGVKRPQHEADHSSSSSAEVWNAWSYTSTPPVRFHNAALWYSGKFVIIIIIIIIILVLNHKYSLCYCQSTDWTCPLKYVLLWATLNYKYGYLRNIVHLGITENFFCGMCNVCVLI
jgi:uncharacterized integral membrane protein